MTTRSWVRAAAWKEFRALAPMWSTCVSVALVVWILPIDFSSGALSFVSPALWRGAPLLFGMTPLVLGALSIGHEFSCGTWGTLLTLPVSRGRLLAIKAAVLFALVVSAGALSLAGYGRLQVAIVADLGRISVAEALIQPMILVPLLGGLLLAPWFTLVTRTAVGGVILALAAPAAAYLVALLSRWVVFGSPETFDLQVLAARFSDAVWVVLTLAVGATGLWRLPRAFVLAEVRDGSSASVMGLRMRRPRVTGAAIRHRSPWALLLWKEARLQTPAFVFGGLFLVLWMASTALANPNSGIFAAYLVFFGTLIPLLAGAVATAEEREMGLLDADTMLPLSSRFRYLWKVGVVMATAVALTVGLGAALTSWTDVRVERLPLPRSLTSMSLAATSAVLLLTTAGLYVSSLTRGGLRALVLSGATVFIAGLLGGMVERGIWSFLTKLQYWIWDREPPLWLRYGGFTAVTRDLRFLPWLVVTGVALMALWFAFQNHRSTGRTPGRVVRQVAWLTGVYATGIATIEVLFRRWS